MSSDHKVLNANEEHSGHYSTGLEMKLIYMQITYRFLCGIGEVGVSS
jgi:hypothetical protein